MKTFRYFFVLGLPIRSINAMDGHTKHEEVVRLIYLMRNKLRASFPFENAKSVKPMKRTTFKPFYR